MRGWVVLLWAVLATIVLVAVGIFGTLLVTGRVVLFPTPTPTATPLPVVTPIVDPSYDVLVLNATPETGLATQMKDVVVAAGWAEDTVLASEAGSTDFAETTIYYYLPDGRGGGGRPRAGDRRGEDRAERRLPACRQPRREAAHDRDRARSHRESTESDAHALTRGGPVFQAGKHFDACVSTLAFRAISP